MSTRWSAIGLLFVLGSTQLQAATIGKVTNWDYLIATGDIAGHDAEAIFRHATGQCKATRHSKPLAVKEGRLSHITLDVYHTTKEFNERLIEAGVTPICYANLGGFENWRPDTKKWQEKLSKNNLIGSKIKKMPVTASGEEDRSGRQPIQTWPGEVWVRAKVHPILREYVTSRIHFAKNKKCVGLELDNLDGYSQGVGSIHNWVAYIGMIADVCKEEGIACGFKNASEIINKLSSRFDFVVTERCRQFKECDVFDKAFVGKPHLNVEYSEHKVYASSENKMHLSRGNDEMKDAIASIRRDCGSHGKSKKH